MKTIGIIILIIIGIGLAAILFVFFIFFYGSTPFSNGAEVIDKKISNQYYFKDDGIVFVRGANFFNLGAQEIENADTESFEVLAYNLAKDKNHVYFDGMIFENANPKTFEMISSGEIIDKTYTYYTYTKDTENAFYFHHEINGADASSYRYLWGDFSRDDTNLYFMEKKLIAISEDPEKVTNDNNEDYLRIGETVYYQMMLIESADTASFSIIKDAFAKDNHAIYSGNRLLENVDPSSFRILDKNYQRDKNHLYYETKPLLKSDPDSYEFINTLFSKDKNNLYYIGSIVMDANPKNYGKREIEKLDNDRSLINLIYDDNYTLFAKRNELIEISRIHNLYKNDVYCLSLRVIGVHYITFKVFEDCEEAYAVDKNNIYCHSQIVKGADIESFQTINGQFAKDKNHVYFYERPLQDINPKTFVYQEGMYGETIDKENDRLVYP